jgi:uncharacterized membrane protein
MNPLNSVQGSIITGFILALIVAFAIMGVDFNELSLARWFHVLAGITWIGLLYYFNVVQVPAFAELEPAQRSAAIDKLASRALWWFRWAAAATVLMGILILGSQDPGGDAESGFSSDYWGTINGTSILTGILLGLIMFLNVWLIIWPQQKIVIANARNVLAGGEADPNAVPAGRKALLASRTNTFFSFSLIWFMVSTSLVTTLEFSTIDGLIPYWIIVLVLVAVLEAFGTGMIGGTGQTALRKWQETVPGVIIAGVALWVVFMIIWLALLNP